MADESTVRVKAHCNRCHGDTFHYLLKETEHREHEQLDPYEPQAYLEWSTKWEMLECCGCADIILRKTYWFSEWDGVEVTYFPPSTSRNPPVWVKKIPRELRETLGEVYSALDANARRLALMGARCLIDIVGNDCAGDLGQFDKKLAALEDRGHLGKTQKLYLEKVVEAGHAAAHRGYNPSAEQLEQVIDIVENVIQSIYILPKSAQAIADTTPPRTKNGKKKI